MPTSILKIKTQSLILEDFTPLVDGVRKDFDLRFPSKQGTELVLMNGLHQTPGISDDCQIVYGPSTRITTIRYNDAPLVGDTITCRYTIEKNTGLVNEDKEF